MSKNPRISRFGRTSRRFGALTLALSIPAAALAQTPLGTVTSSSPFELRGASINPAPGVPNWPAVSGDSMQSGNTPLTLTLSDGSTITFAPRTRITLGGTDNGPVVRLESNSAQATLRRDPSEITFYCKDKKMSVTSRTAEVKCGDKAADTVVSSSLAATAATTAIVLALQNGAPVSAVRCGTVGLPACP